MTSNHTESVFKAYEQHRKSGHKPNPHLDALIKELSAILQPAEKRAVKQFSKPSHPVVFIIGNPRSGTTLMMQVLASTGQFSYPTNLLARFSSTPFIGSKIQLLLTDSKYKFHDELPEFNHAIEYQSDIGKTSGAIAPNEFYHFWRRFTPNYDPQHLTPDLLKQVDWKGIAAGIASIEAAFRKPFATKALLLQYNLKSILQYFDKAIFLYIKRNPFYTIQSLLETREKYYGSRSVWYSVRPPEYEQLIEMDPVHQVAGQVFFTDRSICSELAEMKSEDQLQIDYRKLCEDPSSVHNEIRKKLARKGFDIESGYKGPGGFKPKDQVRLPEADCRNIIQAYKEFAGTVLEP